MNFLTQFWWVTLPRLVRRVAITPYLALTDGLYITAVPPVAAFLSPLIFLIGLLFGSFHLDYKIVFPESLSLLLVAVFIGILSGHLGLMFLVGFAIGDFFLFNPAWMLNGSLYENLFNHSLLIIEYALLGVLVVQIPLITKTLLGQFYIVLRWGKVFSFVAAFISYVFLSVFLVYLWGQIVPSLIRPIVQQTSAMEILQKNISPLLWMAAFASIIRMSLQGWIAFSPKLSERIAATGEAINKDEIKPFTERLPRVIRAFLSGAWWGFIFLGLCETRIEAFIAGSIIFVLQLLRFGVIPLPFLDIWAGWMAKVPILIRLAIGGLLIIGSGAIVLRLFWSESFRPMWVLVIIGLIVLFVINPKVPENELGEQPVTA